MRSLLCSLFLLALTGVPASPFDGEAVSTAYYSARAACRVSEWHEKQLTQQESAEFCLILDALGAQLKANGYCWDNAELIWATCKD